MQILVFVLNLVDLIIDSIIPFSDLQVSLSSFKLAVSFSKSRHLLFASFNSLFGRKQCFYSDNQIYVNFIIIFILIIKSNFNVI